MKPSRKAREEAGGKNYDGFSLPPHGCYVIGVDTQHGTEHPLYGQRAVDVAAGRKPYDERMLRSMHVYGVIEPVRVRLEPTDEKDRAWPPGLRGKIVHVVVTGRHRILHARRVVDQKYERCELRDVTGWQVKCVLEHSKDPKDLHGVQVAENVCRRVLDDDELQEQILRGINAGLTLDEVADRLGIKVSRAKRLQRRAEGVPEKPRPPKVERVSGKHLSLAVARLRADVTDCGLVWKDSALADLIEVVRGRLPLVEADDSVKLLFEPDEEVIDA